MQTLRIFLPMCDINDQDEKQSIRVSVYKSARISDLIGLICCKYINEKRLPKLKYKQGSYNIKYILISWLN